MISTPPVTDCDTDRDLTCPLCHKIMGNDITATCVIGTSHHCCRFCWEMRYDYMSGCVTCGAAVPSSPQPDARFRQRLDAFRRTVACGAFLRGSDIIDHERTCAICVRATLDLAYEYNVVMRKRLSDMRIDLALADFHDKYMEAEVASLQRKNKNLTDTIRKLNDTDTIRKLNDTGSPSPRKRRASMSL